MKDIKEGDIILFSSGEYSDYSIYGIALALQDIKPDVVRNDYINLYPEQTGKYDFKVWIFMEYLEHLGLVKPIAFKEWYTNSYSNISEMNVTDGPMLFT
jgi:hypothetical protein